MKAGAAPQIVQLADGVRWLFFVYWFFDIMRGERRKGGPEKLHDVCGVPKV